MGNNAKDNFLSRIYQNSCNILILIGWFGTKEFYKEKKEMVAFCKQWQFKSVNAELNIMHRKFHKFENVKFVFVESPYYSRSRSNGGTFIHLY